MDELLEILNDIESDVDYDTCTTLIDDGILDSFSIMTLVGEISDAFDVEITPAELIPENFNSAQAMWRMICSLRDEN